MRIKTVKITPVEGEDPKLVEEFQKGSDKIYADLLERGKMFKEEEEQHYYKTRLRAYLKDFVGLNGSSDTDVLFNMLVEAIQMRRILSNVQEVGRPLPEAYTESQTRWHKLMTSLSVRRIDRKKIPDKEEDLRQLFTEIFANNAKALEDHDKTMKEEEEKFAKEKAGRDSSLSLNHER